MTALRTRRVAAGLYTVETPLGVFEVSKVESTGFGLYEPTKMIEWFVTWPGERAPDAVTATLRDAKIAIANEVALKEESS